MPKVNITGESVEKMINNMQKQLATWNAVDRVAQHDDQVTIDFVGKINGDTFEGGSANDSVINIGSGNMIPGFEDGIIGMNKGDQKVITVTFPDDYSNKDLAGKEAEFDVVLKEIKEAELPEIDDQFIEKMGIKGGVTDFAVEIEKNMKRELKNAIQRTLKQQVLTKLNEKNDIEVPKSLIKEEIKRSKQNLLQRMGDQAKNMDLSQIPDNLFESQSKEKVKTSLVVTRLIEQQDIKITDEEVNTYIDELSEVYEDKNEVLAHLEKNKNEMENIKGLVLETKLVDWVVSKAKLENKDYDFFEFVQASMPNQSM